jgi:hypothetical protein
MTLQAQRQRVPSSALRLLAERQEALLSAYRTSNEPQIDLSSVRRIALAVVVRGGALDLYKTRNST